MAVFTRISIWSKNFDDLRHTVVNLIAIPHVTLDSRRCRVLRLQLCRDYLGGWPVDVNHGDVSAFFDEHPSYAATNALRRTRDDCDLLGE